MPTGRPINDNIKCNVVNTYLSRPMTIAQCASIYGLSNPTVIKILDEYNVERYKKARLFSPDLDEYYFCNIDNEHKAYWIGFLITDGNIFIPEKNGQASISITQNENRSYILQAFLDDIKSSTRVTQDGRGTCMAAVRSDIMANDLLKYGITPSKTLNTSLPILEEEYMSHLIRGILDGDGSVTSTITSRNKHKHAFSFCGTHRLMEDIGLYISNAIGISHPKTYDYSDRHLSEIKWQSISDCETLGDWLYKDATIYLQDKKDKFYDFLKYYKHGNTEVINTI